MAAKIGSDTPHAKIVVGLPNLQDQIGMINKVSNLANDVDSVRWEDMKDLLSELYSQLQKKKQVTVFRLNNRNETKLRPNK